MFSEWLRFTFLLNEVIHVEAASWAGSQYMLAEYISEFQKYFLCMAFPPLLRFSRFFIHLYLNPVYFQLQLLLSRFSRVLLFAVLWIAACKAGIFQAKILDGLPCPLLGDLPNPGLEPVSAALQADLYHWATREAHIFIVPECKAESQAVTSAFWILAFCAFSFKSIILGFPGGTSWASQVAQW